MLQLKEIPRRPVTYDGVICLFDLADGVNKAGILAALSKFGQVESCELSVGRATVRFTTQAAALGARRAAPQLQHICGGVDKE